MSNARNLADVISGNYDVPAGSLDNVDLSSRVAKTGDTMTGALTVSAGGQIFESRNADTYSRFTAPNGSAQLGLFRSGSSAGGFYIGGDANSFRIYDDSFTPRFFMDTAGRVTMPYQPCFTAYKTSGNDSSYVDPVIFNATHLNVGNHYNTSTGKFTAPVTGNYMFIGSIDPTSTGSLSVQFVKNGGDVTNIRTYSSLADGSQATAGIIPLAAGDTFWLRTNIGCESSLSWFTGYLIG